jgi:hypothetical protein
MSDSAASATEPAKITVSRERQRAGRENCDPGMLRWRSVKIGMSQYEPQAIRA